MPNAKKTPIGVKRPAVKVLQSASTRKRKPRSANKLLRYFCATALLIIALVVVRGAIAWAGESFIYTLPILGGLLKSLELMEVSNVLVFAILGVCLGAFTQWLPKRWGLAPKAVPLILSVPLVFLTGYSIRHHLWVQQVSVESELLPVQARQFTDSLLQEATGNQGLWGFFKYTVQVPILPTDLSALKTVDDDDKWFRSELTRYSGLEPGIFTRLFQLTGWGIRLFHTALAAVTASLYFTKGLVWANARRSQPPR
ncbi:MAG: hypothetical protein AAGH78_12770 [Cyanobacteria bacterium P01_H01_bin.58]